MSTGNLKRFDLVECIVTGRQGYGLLVRTEAGEPGFIDSVDIADGAVSADDWPATGTRLACVFLGYTNDGRARVASAASYVQLVRNLDDPRLALREWRELRVFSEDDEVVRRFFQSRNARPLLAWGLRNPVGTDNFNLAISLLGRAPDDLREGLSPP